MSYRVETALSGRAVCRATECKKNGVKIEKDELRMGTWVSIEDNASWTWKHWGCVTGFQLQNIRNSLEDPNNPGTYRWDYLDGYEGDEKNSLEKHPDLQEKVRRVITQGFIDPEDFNGDPEMNKLGEKGLYTPQSKKKMRQDQITRTKEIEELKAKVEALTTERDQAIQKGNSTKKIDIKMVAAKDNLEGAEKGTKSAAKKDPKEVPVKEKAAKRKRSSAIKEEDDEDDDYGKAAKKSRAKKVKKEDTQTVKEEDDDEPAAVIATTKRGKQGKGVVKDEPVDDEQYNAELSEVKPKITKKSKGKKAVKEESLDEQNDIDQAVEDTKTASKNRSKKGSKKATKQDNSETNPLDSIDPSSGALATASTESYIQGIKDSDLQYSFDTALDAGEIDDDFEAYIEMRKAELAASKQKKGAKGKKSESKSRRSSRNKAE